MADQDFNIGPDIVVDIFDPMMGGILVFNKVTGFSKRQVTNRITSRGMDGRRRDRNIPDGWEGTVMLDRASSAVDDYFAALEDAHFRGRIVRAGTITETINEVDGGISQYRYDDVTFTLEQGGESRGDSKIEQSIAWTAGRRRKVV